MLRVMQLFGGKFGRNDRLLAHDEQPAPGSHLVTPRLGFAHHGIYVGDDQVVHYGSALGHHLLGGPVEVVSLAHFALGRAVWVRSSGPLRFDSAEVVRRACSRVGENSYRVLSNNCEHFCEWCLHGEHRSYQVEKLLALPRKLRRTILALLARPFPVSPLRAESDRL
jgi:hypothetical protein